MNKLLLIDGNGIIHRAYHALPPFTTKDGFPTNAIFGFFSILNKAVKEFQPDFLVVCFDTPVPSFRKKIFAEYQAQRPKIEDKLSIQFKVVKEGLDKGGVFHLEKEGFEGDDLIGSLTFKFKNEKLRILILSGDRDILQLVDKNVLVITPQVGFSKSKIYDVEEIKNKFGILPSQISDFKALVGDPSDNYKGAKGIGPKIAKHLLNRYQSIEEIYKNLDHLDEKIKKILIANQESIFLSLKLAKILTDIDLKEIDLEKIKFQGFKNELKDFLLKYEIKSLVTRFFEEKFDKTKQKENNNFKKNNEQIKLF